MRHSILVPFILVVNFRMVCALPDDIFSGEGFDESGFGFAGGPSLFDNTMENLDLTSKLSDFQAFDLDADLDDSNTDIVWDPELTLADAAVLGFCASQAAPLSLEARNGASCSPSRQEELLPSSQSLQLLEDSMLFLDNNFPYKGQIDEEKPAYPGLLTEEQIKEKGRREGGIWSLFRSRPDTDDPCDPYRSRGYIYNVCCQQRWDNGGGMERWYINLDLEGCHTSMYCKSIYVELNHGPIFYVRLPRLILILQFGGGNVKNPIKLVVCS